jgi:hypothetical protein
VGPNRTTGKAVVTAAAVTSTTTGDDGGQRYLCQQPLFN